MYWSRCEKEMLQGEISSRPRTVVNLELDSRSLVFIRYSKSIYIYSEPFSCKSQLCWWKPLTFATSPSYYIVVSRVTGGALH